MLVARRGILLQTFLHDPLQSKRQAGLDLIQGQRRLIQQAVDGAVNGLPLEGMVARHHLVKHRPEGKNVRPLVDLGIAELFGRHIPRRSHHLSGDDACYRQR